MSKTSKDRKHGECYQCGRPAHEHVRVEHGLECPAKKTKAKSGTHVFKVVFIRDFSEDAEYIIRHRGTLTEQIQKQLLRELIQPDLITRQNVKLQDVVMNKTHSKRYFVTASITFASADQEDAVRALQTCYDSHGMSGDFRIVNRFGTKKLRQVAGDKPWPAVACVIEECR